MPEVADNHCEQLPAFIAFSVIFALCGDQRVTLGELFDAAGISGYGALTQLSEMAIEWAGSLAAGVSRDAIAREFVALCGRVSDYRRVVAADFSGLG